MATAFVGVNNGIDCLLRYFHGTSGLGALSESLQRFGAAVNELCLLCPAASTDGLKESLNCGNQPKASTWGLSGWHYSKTNMMPTPPDSSPAATPAQAFLQI